MLRFFMGGDEAAATPANAKTIGEWFPKSERPIAAGWAGVGFSIGAMLAPPIIYFAHASFGWQGAFMFTGALALLWVILWWAFYQTPEKHPNLSNSELEYIKQDNEAPPVKQPFFTALKTVSKINVSTGSPFPPLWPSPPGGAEFLGAAAGERARHGFEADRHVCTAAVSRRRSRQRGQRLPHPPVCSLVRLYASELGDRQLGNRRVPDALLALVAITRDPYITIILISIGGFGHQIISCMLSALVVESFDKGQMATVNGMRGSAAWIASFLFSLLIGVTADKIGFNPLFIAMGFFDLIGAVFLVAFIAERRAKRA